MQDDQDGTAAVVLGAVLSAMRAIGKDLRKVTVGQLGLGAAGLSIANLLKGAHRFQRSPRWPIARIFANGGDSVQAPKWFLRGADKSPMSTTGVERRSKSGCQENHAGNE